MHSLESLTGRFLIKKTNDFCASLDNQLSIVRMYRNFFIRNFAIIQPYLFLHVKAYEMQGNLFEDLKSLKDKISQEEKNVQEKLITEQKQEKEKKLHEQFEKFMQNSGVRKLD